MAEYIELEEAIAWFMPYAHTGENIDADVVISDIKGMKAADVAPVVRCWDCKHCDPENYHCDHPMGTAAPLKRKPDDFCSYGERKDSDSNAKEN